MNTTDQLAQDELAADLRTTLQAVSEDLGGVGCARGLLGTPNQGHDAHAWQVLSEQVGIAGLGLPESSGGLGGVPALSATAEVLGATLLPVPVLGSTVLTGQVLARCGPAADEALEQVAEGVVGCLAIDDAVDRRAPGLVSWTVDGDGLVSGSAYGIIAADQARWLVAVTEDTVMLVDMDQPSCTVRTLPCLDLTRSLGAITLERAVGTVLSDDPRSAVGGALDVATTYLAAEQLGGSQACLDMTVSYVKSRHQFSRAIGSFQAVKHTLADALVKVEMARSAVLRAVDLSGDEETFAEASLVARTWCNEAYQFVTAETVQLHGGIGFTWEHDAHLFFRRARSDAALLGTTVATRERLATVLGW